MSTHANRQHRKAGEVAAHLFPIIYPEREFEWPEIWGALAALTGQPNDTPRRELVQTAVKALVERSTPIPGVTEAQLNKARKMAGLRN